MKSFKFAAVALALCLMGGAIRADFIAYDVNSGLVGNQSNFAGAIGMDFNLNASISITQLGVFDSGGDGLASSHVVSLYDRDTQAQLLTFTIAAGTGTLVNGSRFITLATPFDIDVTQHSHLTIVAEGFNSLDKNYNTFNVNPSPSTLDTSGFLTFVGTGRFGPAGSFPATVDGRNSVNPYAAGTFAFVPEPSSTILLGMGLVGFVGYSSRRRMLAKKSKNEEA